MDANGTRFHLLFGYDDWARCAVAGESLAVWWDGSPPRAESVGLAWSDARAELTLRPRLFKHIAAPADAAPSPAARRGAGRDRYGNWYWIDETREKLLVLSSGSGVTSEFWPAAATAPCPPPRFGSFKPAAEPVPSAPRILSGLAVTEDHYLVVGTLAPAGLLIFDLHAGGAPRELRWPREAPFAPFDMAPRPGGGVWILDQLNRRYWALDRNFNVVADVRDEELPAAAHAEDFQSCGGGATRRTPSQIFPRGITLELASPLALHRPIALEALPDGTVLILDEATAPTRFSLIYRFAFARQLGAPVSTAVMQPRIEAEQAADFTLRGFDLAFVPAHEETGARVPDRLYVAAAEGNQAFAFDLCLRGEQLVLQPVAEFLPMRLFGGKGLVTAGTGAWYDFADRWVPLIRQRRPRYEAEAVLLTPLLDGQEPDCVWHRLLLDACVPPETSVTVRSRAANDEIDLELAAWQPEPNFYRRGDGAELPFMPRQSPGAATWELLFQQARGRYLQLELTLAGNERATPRVQALRAYYPRFSYLNNYLPGVYREDELSASFLDRFLANLEGFYTALEDKIAAVQMLLDVRSAPAEALDWLAGWFGVALDPSWDEAKRRLFISHAPAFFQARGTRRGLQMALRLALEPCADETIFEPASYAPRRPERIRIVEKFLTRRTPGVVFGDPTDLQGLRLVTPTAARWEPSQGRDELRRRYTIFRNPAGGANQPLGEFPLTAPADPAEAAAWQQFARATLGFVPSSFAAAERRRWQTFRGGDDAPLPTDWPATATARSEWERFSTNDGAGAVPLERQRWQDFLARRYRRSAALNEQYRTNWPSFAVVPLPETLPADGAPLQDWFHFEGVVLAMHDTAHLFTVLLPTAPGLDHAAYQRQLDLAQRIVELEKPAQTRFDVKFYWALFRLGEARLGSDTLVDRGSRAPELLPPLVLGAGYAGESYLGPTAVETATDRHVLNRDELGLGWNRI